MKPGDMRWRCGVCGSKRLDKYIDVISYSIKDFPGAVANFKYCNDKESCLEGAKEKAKIRNI